MRCYFCRNKIDDYNIGEIGITLNKNEILKKSLCNGCITTLANGIIACHNETAPNKIQKHVSLMNSDNGLDLSKLQSEIEKEQNNNQ